MSSWIGASWEGARALSRSAHILKRERGGFRTICKLGRHAILELDPALWVTDSRLAPLGLSCVPCLKAKAAELGLEVPEEPAAPKVPAARTGRRVPPPEEWVHGSASTYQNLKCRCVPCREANSRRSAEYRARRRGVLQ